MKKKIIVIFILLSGTIFAQNQICFEQKAFDYYINSVLKPMPQYNKIFVNKYLKKNDYSKFSSKILRLNNLKMNDTILAKSTCNISNEIEVKGNKKFVITSNLKNKFPNISICSVSCFVDINVVIIHENYKLKQRVNYIYIDNKGVVIKTDFEEEKTSE